MALRFSGRLNVIQVIPSWSVSIRTQVYSFFLAKGFSLKIKVESEFFRSHDSMVSLRQSRYETMSLGFLAETSRCRLIMSTRSPFADIRSLDLLGWTRC